MNSLGSALPLRFPNAADQVFYEAQRLRGQPSTERFMAILDLIASGHRLLKDSSRRGRAEELRARDKQEWRLAHRNLFAKHGF
jgi:hypothetical protein